MYLSDSRPVPEERQGRQSLTRTVVVYAIASLLAFLFDRIYALFAHGIESDSMRWMFLFPLLGGVAVYGLLALVLPAVTKRRGWRAGLNLYNSGIAALTVGSLLQGVFEIAGTASVYTAVFFVFGVIFAVMGILFWVIPPGS